MQILTAANLVKIYPGGITAVDNISFSVDKNTITVLMGPNGSGKTTTLNMVAGSLKPTSGEIRVCNYNVWGSSKEYLKARECMGYAPQDMPFREKLSVMENLIWYGMIRGLSITTAKQQALRVLETTDILEHKNKRVTKLSGGQRRRLAISMALLGDPELLILDEPTSGLDPAAREELWVLLESLSKEKTILLSTHIAEEAERHADYVYIFYNGRIAAEGSPEALIREHARGGLIRIQAHDAEFKKVRLDRWRHSVKDGTIIVEVEDPNSELPEVIKNLLSQGVSIKSVEIVKPGLEQVFFAVTGARISGQK